LLSAHYRQPLDWTSEVLPEAKRKLDRLYGALRDVPHRAEASGAPDPEFLAALDDDLNTPKALAVLFDLARSINRSEAPDERQDLAARLRASAAILGLLAADPAAWFQATEVHGLTADAVEGLLAQRLAARKSKDFTAADRLRDELVAAGIVILDGPEGTRWRRAGN
jgi:cysteinyl-tRNA synthetase